MMVVILGGGLWLRHTLEGPSSPPPEVAKLPTHLPPSFHRTPATQRRQPDTHFESDDIEMAQQPAAPARNMPPPLHAPGETRMGTGSEVVKVPSNVSGTGGPAAVTGARPSRKGGPPGAAMGGSSDQQEFAAAGSGDEGDQSGSQQAPGQRAGANPGSMSAGSMGLGSAESANATNEAPPIIERGLQTDDDGGALRVPPDGQLAYPDRGGLDPNRGTMAFWARLDSDTAFAGRALAQLATATSGFRINMGTGFVGLVLTNAEGEQTTSYTKMSWQPGVWHHIATTWGDAIMQLYVDAHLVDQQSYAGTLELPASAPLFYGNQRIDTTLTPPPSGPTVSLWPKQPVIRGEILEPDQVASVMTQTAPPQK
jgi:hypothetical protein